VVYNFLIGLLPCKTAVSNIKNPGLKGQGKKLLIYLEIGVVGFLIKLLSLTSM
jgi:hypothetical protein